MTIAGNYRTLLTGEATASADGTTANTMLLPENQPAVLPGGETIELP